MNKQYIKIIALSAALLMLIVVATFLYGKLSEGYEPAVQTTDITTGAAATEDIVRTADFTVTDKDGNSVDLSDFFGKPIVVNFWETWCSPCTSEMPHFEEAYKTYGDVVTFLMINVGDSYDDAYEYTSNKGYTFPVFHDTSYSASYAYGVSSIPMTLFINADGELVSSRVGMLSNEILINGIESIK